MKRITYSKFFQTGNLTGLSVRCSFTVPSELCHERSMELQAINVLNHKVDLQGSKYYIYNVGSEELPAQEVR